MGAKGILVLFSSLLVGGYPDSKNTPSMKKACFGPLTEQTVMVGNHMLSEFSIEVEVPMSYLK